MDEVIIGAPYSVTKEMIEQAHISMVVHGTDEVLPGLDGTDPYKVLFLFLFLLLLLSLLLLFICNNIPLSFTYTHMHMDHISIVLLPSATHI